MIDGNDVFLAVPAGSGTMTSALGPFLWSYRGKFPSASLSVLSGVRDGIPYVRNGLSRRFLEQSDKRWLWFWDSDVAPAKNCLALLELEADVIGGTYPRAWAEVNGPLKVYDMVGGQKGEMASLAAWELEPREVTWVPFGCVLIARHVLEDPRMGSAGTGWFEEEFSPVGRKLNTDDVLFCAKARKLGYKVVMHTGVRNGHAKTMDLAALREPLRKPSMVTAPVEKAAQHG